MSVDDHAQPNGLRRRLIVSCAESFLSQYRQPLIMDSEGTSTEDPQTVTVLLEFGTSKQQLKLEDPSFTAVVIEVEKALGAIGRDISVLCPGKSPSGSKEVFVLQRDPRRCC